MGKNSKQNQRPVFEVQKQNMYREEAYTDLHSATIRKLIPVNVDGSPDESRRIVYIGHADLISPQGPIPIQSELQVDSLEKAIEALPNAMGKEADNVREEYNKMQQQQQQGEQQQQDSKVIKSTDQM